MSVCAQLNEPYMLFNDVCSGFRATRKLRVFDTKGKRGTPQLSVIVGKLTDG